MPEDDSKVWVYGLEGEAERVEEPTEKIAPVVPKVEEHWGEDMRSTDVSDHGKPARQGRAERPSGQGIDWLLMLAVLVGSLLGVAVWATFFRHEAAPEPLVYEVVSGDSLWRIANTHGVSVASLKEWNQLQGDNIEVGQVLRIWPPEAGGPIVTQDAGGRKGRIKGGRIEPTPVPQDPGGLRMPQPKRCLTIDEAALDDEDGPSMVATRGLSYQQTRTAMDAFLPTLARCVDSEAAVQGTVTMEIIVGCNGRVQDVRVAGIQGLSADVVRCSKETLAYVPFPAHDMPDGFTFAYPLSFDFSE